MSKPTPGPWSPMGQDVKGPLGVKVCFCGANGTYGGSLGTYQIREAEAIENARLIAEAGTAFHETGLTPRELAAQRAELLEALEALLAADVYADGEGLVNVADSDTEDGERAVKMARAAIARATGQDASR